MWNKDGIEFHWWTGHTRRHKHGDYYEIFIVADGGCSHVTQTGTRVLSKGDLVFMPAAFAHEIKLIEGAACIHMNFSVQKELFGVLCDTMNPLLREALADYKYEIVTKLSEEELAFFFDNVRRISTVKTEGNALNTSVLKMLVCAVVVHLSFSIREKERTTIYPQWLCVILNKLDKLENFILPLSEIYKMSNYSTAVFLKYFKTYMNETLQSYVTRKKMEHACFLLAHTHHNVLTISSALNFDSLSHFSSIFKKSVGMTPTQYRNKACKKEFPISK